jgi:hypothetical protein
LGDTQYISTNNATMNAENVPKVRQSRVVFALKKLKANRMKTAALMITKDHRPYAGASRFIKVSGPCHRGRELHGWHDPGAHDA